MTYILKDAKGEDCGHYRTAIEAFDDAVGPRWRPKFTIVKKVKSYAQRQITFRHDDEDVSKQVARLKAWAAR